MSGFPPAPRHLVILAALPVLVAMNGVLAAQEGAAFDPGCALPFAALAIHHPIDDECGRDGKMNTSAVNLAQNHVKSNFCARNAPAVVTHRTFVQLQEAAGSSRFLADRAALQDLLEISPGTRIGEGSVVQLVAFIVTAHTSNIMNGETVNCLLRGAESNDIHIVLGESQAIDACDSVTAEMSPHFRPLEWNPALLTGLDHPVRITGQLFYDGSHRPCTEGHPSNPKRISVWEIHPVYALEVCTGATFADCPAADATRWRPLDSRTARNSTGLELLRQGKSTEAAKVFAGEEVEVLAATDLTPADKARFLYNYGIALQQSRQASDAARRFLKSRELDAQLAGPVDAFLKLTWGELAHPSETLTPLVALLVKQKDLPNAGATLRFAFTQAPPAEDPEFYDGVLPLFLRYLTAARIGPREFRGDWQPLVLKRSPAMSESAQARAQLIARAYLSDLGVTFDRTKAGELTAPWRGAEESAEFAAFLTMAGNRLLSESSTHSALSLYSLAWTSSQDVEAAVQLAALLLKYSRLVDADGRIMEDFIVSLFESKGGAYLSNDWPNVFRLHNLLASIFEQQKKWGDKADPRGAIFQLDHALQASSRLELNAQTLLDAVPSLHARLGRAWQAAGKPQDARGAYLAAAKAYLEANRPEGAETVLFLAKQVLAPPADPAQQREIDDLSSKVRQAEENLAAASQISDSRTTEVVLAKLGADPDIRLDRLKVQTKNGTVTISGEGTHQKWHEIESLVKSTAGAKGLRHP